ncbi:unnamed protein product [Pipistrellus nathusii]|uniref:Uncharacterized protein n=1 Tax=Pipistrellus nathusii TaxID=59473 RepID=A0ABP0A3Q6_PIPNA
MFSCNIKINILKIFSGQNLFGSVYRALACGLKGPGFDFGQGHVPWLRAHPQEGVCKRQLIDDSLSSMFLTLYPSLFLSVKKKSIKHIFKKYFQDWKAFWFFPRPVGISYRPYCVTSQCQAYAQGESSCSPTP